MRVRKTILEMTYKKIFRFRARARALEPVFSKTQDSARISLEKSRKPQKRFIIGWFIFFGGTENGRLARN